MNQYTANFFGMITLLCFVFAFNILFTQPFQPFTNDKLLAGLMLTGLTASALFMYLHRIANEEKTI